VKSSKQILRLPVLSIEEGKKVGVVKELILNPKQGTVDFLLVEDDAPYLGLKGIPFEAVQGIGEFALTVASCSSLSPVAEINGAIDLIKKNLYLPGTRVLTRKGRLVGSISEYFVDDNTGAVVGCQLIPVNDEKPAGIIPRELILTYGSDFLVVEEDVENRLIAEIPEESLPLEKTGAGAVSAAFAAPADSADDNRQFDTLKHFEDQQRQYLLGKKVAVRIVSDSGELVAEEGEIITSETIERAKKADRYIQLTLNVRD